MPTFHHPASDAAEAQQALHPADARHPHHQRPLSHDWQDARNNHYGDTEPGRTSGPHRWTAR